MFVLGDFRVPFLQVVNNKKRQQNNIFLALPFVDRIGMILNDTVPSTDDSTPLLKIFDTDFDIKPPPQLNIDIDTNNLTMALLFVTIILLLSGDNIHYYHSRCILNMDSNQPFSQDYYH